MTSGPRTGKFGIIHGNASAQTANAIKHMFDWSFNPTMAEEERVYSNTRAGTDREEGVEDWTANFNIYTGFDPLLLPGSIFNIDMYGAPDNGVYGSNGDIVYGRCIVDSIQITWSYQPSQSLQMVANVSGLSCYGVRKGLINDLGTTEPQKMCNLPPVEWSANEGTLWNRWQNLEQVTLTIMKNNAAYVNSSTCCGTGRREGNLDWEVVITEQEMNFLVPKGAKYWLRFYVNQTDFWELAHNLFINYSNFRVSRQESETITTKDVNFRMKALDDEAAQQVGHALLADGASTVWWPPTPVDAPILTINDLVVTGAAGSAGLAWTQTGEGTVTGERIYRAPTCCGPFILLEEIAPAGMYTDNSVPYAGTWWYYVTSSSAGGESERSNIDSDAVT